MNDEIRKILDKLKSDNYPFGIATIDINKLLDYITNLQQLCNKYEEEHNTTFKEWQKDIQANKKAIEYIKEAIENGDYFEDDIATDISEPSYDKYVNSDSLLNILQNGDDK